MITNLQSVMPYMGSKRIHLDFIESHLPRNWKRTKNYYLEPFLGSGVVFHHINPVNAVIADASPYLVCLFKCLQQDVHRFLECLQRLCDGNSLTQYNQCKKDIMTATDKWVVAASFVYVHQASLYSFACPRIDLSEFRGTYKSNRGPARSLPLSREKWMILASVLMNPGVRLLESDFEPVMNQAQAGDFLFLDPPYIGTGTRVYLKFTKKDHIRLMAKIREVSQRGVYVMMFNHRGLDLSKNPELIATPVPPRKRNIGNYVEAMYTNYTPQESQELSEPTRYVTISRE